MRIFQFDKAFRNNSSIFATVALILVLVFAELPFKIFILFLFGIYIYINWCNIVETIKIDKDSFQMNVRVFNVIKKITLRVQDINYSYRLEGGFRKSIMKLRIYHEEKDYEISISTNWNDRDIQEIVEIFINNNAKKINL